jgi:hypothetical protein
MRDFFRTVAGVTGFEGELVEVDDELFRGITRRRRSGLTAHEEEEVLLSSR